MFSILNLIHLKFDLMLFESAFNSFHSECMFGIFHIILILMQIVIQILGEYNVISYFLLSTVLVLKMDEMCI